MTSCKKPSFSTYHVTLACGFLIRMPTWSMGLWFPIISALNSSTASSSPGAGSREQGAGIWEQRAVGFPVCCCVCRAGICKARPGSSSSSQSAVEGSEGSRPFTEGAAAPRLEGAACSRTSSVVKITHREVAAQLTTQFGCDRLASY
eukprot:760573-Hanusia_phi.AAC.1